MAKKAKPSIQEGLKAFKEVMLRASLSDYTYVNKTMLSKNPKDKSVLVVPEMALWNAILDDEELKDHLKSIEPNDPMWTQTGALYTYGDTIAEEGWFDIDTTVLYAGKIIKISIDGFDYQLTINRDCLPLKLKKAEYNNIQYKVFVDQRVLAIKKYFPYEVDQCGYTMMRLFQII